MTSKEELQWVLRAQCGDREALEALLRSAQPRLRQYLCGLVGTSLADDVLQEVLIVICRKVRWLRIPELFWPWAYRIASRSAFRHLKTERSRPEESMDARSLADLAEPISRPPTSLVEELLQSGAIPPASRAVLALHFQQELPLAEVAAILEIPLGTVKSRLAAGLAALRNQFCPERSL